MGWSLCHLKTRFDYKFKKKRRQEEKGAIDRQVPPKSSPDLNKSRVCQWSKSKSPFFLLSPDVREQILREAFGDQTVHMDLTFRHPFKVLTSNKRDLKNKRQRHHHHMHANISINLEGPGSIFDVRDRRRPERWRWYSCVCHRHHPDHQLSHGRRGSALAPTMREPQLDKCFQATGFCAEHPGKWPDKCFIGVMGWLLTCRQAYWEGMQVLYRTNTIHIASSALIQDIHNFLTLNVLSMMTSVELVWRLEEFTVEEAFSRHIATVPCYVSSIEYPSVTFPALRYLRIAFKPSFGLRHNFHPQQRQKESETIYEYFLPKLDSLLTRIAPSTAEIIVSWQEWGIYSLFDLKLFEVQGKDKTLMIQPGIGGIACWRELPSPVLNSAPGSVDREHQSQQLMDMIGRDMNCMVWDLKK
ncbi:unnamed protein product, partial [Clonostachys byssicola]